MRKRAQCICIVVICAIAAIALNIGTSAPSLPPIRHGNISVTFAFSLRVSDLCRAQFHIPHILRNSGYKFESVIVYLDIESPPLPHFPPCKHNTNLSASSFSLRNDGTLQSSDESIVKGLNDLLRDKTIHAIRLVSGSSYQTQRARLKKILSFSSSSHSKVLSFLLPLEECKSTFCAHLDIDVLLYANSRAHYSWIAAGIRELNEDPSIAMILPPSHASEKEPISPTGNYLIAKEVWRWLTKTPWPKEESLGAQWLGKLEEMGVRIKEAESAHPDRMWAMHISRVHPVFHHNIIRCLHRDEFPRQQRSKFHWVPDWTSYHCIGSVGEKESVEEEQGSKKVTERWLRGCLLQPAIDDSSYRQVTLSFTSVIIESYKSLLVIPHLVCAAQYPFAKVILYVDSPIQGTVDTDLHRLVEAGWVNEIRLVERDPVSYKKVMEGVFNPPNSISTNVGNKGLLSYVQGLQECDTDYCLHFDDDIMMYIKPGYRLSWVAEGIKYLEANPSVAVLSPPGGPSDRTIFVKQRTMTTRYYLLRKKKWEEMKPVPYYAGQHFEAMVGDRIRELGWSRNDLPAASEATEVAGGKPQDLFWAIHIEPDVPPAQIPGMVYCMDKGRFPPEQRGSFDTTKAWAGFTCST